MDRIATIPYREVEFDKKGNLLKEDKLPPGVTDLIVISHGWNNDAADARELYRKLFENFAATANSHEIPGTSFAIVGVIWPSKKFDELIAVSNGEGGTQGSASLSAVGSKSLSALLAKIDRMKDFFVDPDQRKALDTVKALLPDLEEKASTRRAFVNEIRSLVDSLAANKEDASEAFFKDDGNELMKNLTVEEEDLDAEVAGTPPNAALPLGTGGPAPVGGGSAGLKTFLAGFHAAAMNVLNYTTYYEMKARAGLVGKIGVAPLIDRLALDVPRIHLVGHSFGGRVVAASAASSTTDKIRSLTLLQAAFSHHGFSKTQNGFFRQVVEQRRIRGPILVTYTKNDKAVGVAYPLASRLNGDRAAAFGDENDVFGGIGRNGAQKMQSDETVVAKLLAVGQPYAFQVGKFFNLEASDFIKDHSDVTGRQVAHALRQAMAL
jgi:hypothetical protein